MGAPQVQANRKTTRSYGWDRIPPSPWHHRCMLHLRSIISPSLYCTVNTYRSCCFFYDGCQQNKQAGPGLASSLVAAALLLQSQSSASSSSSSSIYSIDGTPPCPSSAPTRCIDGDTSLGGASLFLNCSPASLFPASSHTRTHSNSTLRLRAVLATTSTRLLLLGSQPASQPLPSLLLCS